MTTEEPKVILAMGTTLGLDQFNYQSRLVDSAALAAATEEEIFNRESYDLLVELLQSVVLVAGLQRADADGGPRPLTRNEAILAGLMVRCMKLQRGSIEVCQPQRMELLIFFQRGITEAAVNLAYLIDHGTPEIFDAFVRHSLRVDRGLYDEILESVEGSGVELPIEERMLAGIRNSFEKAGIDIDTVRADERGSWSPRGVYGRFEAVGYKQLYRAYYETQSHSIHGNWHDLLIYHLDDVPDGFQPQLEFHGIRPQPLLGAVEILADASVRYLRDVAPDSEERTVLEDRLWLCHKKAREIHSLHEGFLQRQAVGSSPS
jgi:hypothetical protein